MLPGQLLTLNFENDNKLELKKESYKSINDLYAEYEFNAVTNDDLYNDFRKILSESILERAQKNCAVFLSGGVDSSLLPQYYRKIINYQFRHSVLDLRIKMTMKVRK